MQYCIKPPELFVLSTFLASVGHQSLFSSHFFFLANLVSIQQIIALLLIRAVVLALSPPPAGWRVIGMVIPHFMVVSISGDGSEEVSPSDLLVVSPGHLL